MNKVGVVAKVIQNVQYQLIRPCPNGNRSPIVLRIERKDSLVTVALVIGRQILAAELAQHVAASNALARGPEVALGGEFAAGGNHVFIE